VRGGRRGVDPACGPFGLAGGGGELPAEPRVPVVLVVLVVRRILRGAPEAGCSGQRNDVAAHLLL
jgi:hypothetical protein